MSKIKKENLITQEEIVKFIKDVGTSEAKINYFAAALKCGFHILNIVILFNTMIKSGVKLKLKDDELDGIFLALEQMIKKQ